MLIIARTLAVLSVLFTLSAIEIIGLQYLPIGFEATGGVGRSFLLACNCDCPFGYCDCERACGIRKESGLFIHCEAFRHFFAWPGSSRCGNDLDRNHAMNGCQEGFAPPDSMSELGQNAKNSD